MIETIKLFVRLLPLFFVCVVGAEAQEKIGSARVKKIDTATGLKIASGWQTVRVNCTACHSAKLIIAHQGDRNFWLETIRWMQRTQGLWELDFKTENTILNYLVEQYPPVRSGRRANLPASALPPNPWR